MFPSSSLPGATAGGASWRTASSSSSSSSSDDTYEEVPSRQATGNPRADEDAPNLRALQRTDASSRARQAGARAARPLFAEDEHVLRDPAMVPPGQRCAPVRPAHLVALDPAYEMALCPELRSLVGGGPARANATLLPMGSNAPGRPTQNLLLFQPLALDANVLEVPNTTNGHRLLMCAFAQHQVADVVLVHERQPLLPPMNMFEHHEPTTAQAAAGAAAKTPSPSEPDSLTIVLLKSNDAPVVCRLRVHRLSIMDDPAQLVERVRSIDEASRQGTAVAIGCADGSDHSGLFSLLLHQRAVAHQRQAAGAVVDAPSLVSASLRMMLQGRSRRGTGFADCVGEARFSALLQRHADQLAMEFSPARSRRRDQAQAVAQAMQLVRARRQEAAQPPLGPAAAPSRATRLVPLSTARSALASAATQLPAASPGARPKRLAVEPAKTRPSPSKGSAQKPPSAPPAPLTASASTASTAGPSRQRPPVLRSAHDDCPPPLPPRPTTTPAPPPLPPRPVGARGVGSNPHASTSSTSPSHSSSSAPRGASGGVRSAASAGPHRHAAARDTALAGDDRAQDRLMDMLNALSPAAPRDEGASALGPLSQRLTDFGASAPEEQARLLERHLVKVVKALIHPRPWLGAQEPPAESQHQAVLWQVRELSDSPRGLGPIVFSEEGPFDPTASGAEEQVMRLLTDVLSEAYAALPPHRQNRWRERVDVRGPIQEHLSAVVEAIHRGATEPVTGETLAHRQRELQALLFSHAVLQAVARAPDQASG